MCPLFILNNIVSTVHVEHGEAQLAKVTVGVVVAVTEAVLPVVVMSVTVAVLLAVVVAHDGHPPQQPKCT